MKRYQARLLAVTLILTSLTLTVGWELYFDDRLNTTSVYQIKEPLSKGHTISASDLTFVKIPYHVLPDQFVTDLNQIIGKETLYPLNKGTIAVLDFFDSPDIIPDPDQMIVPVPDEWIYSLPGSLRRRDKVNVYSHYTPSLQSQKSPDAFQAIDQRASAPAGQQVLSQITVAYAKDSSNHEVKPSDNKLDRIDATGNISQLELVLTQEQFKQLETRALEGYKFIFTYR